MYRIEYIYIVENFQIRSNTKLEESGGFRKSQKRSKKIEKNFKKVLTKGKRRGIIMKLTQTRAKTTGREQHSGP